MPKPAGLLGSSKERTGDNLGTLPIFAERKWGWLRRGCRTIPDVLAAALVVAAIAAVSLLAPTEKTMGDAQRILYVHVAVAWCGLAGFLITACSGLLYLLRRDLSWDHWAQAAAEISWLCCGLTLVTGSFWAHAAWNTWWTWEPRLAATAILWAVSSGYLIVRSGVEDPRRRARIGARNFSRMAVRIS